MMFDLKDPSQLAEVMTRVKREYINEAKAQDKDKMLLTVGATHESKARAMVDLYEAGERGEVPSPWSVIFMQVAEDYRAELLKFEDPDWAEYLRLQKKFA